MSETNESNNVTNQELTKLEKLKNSFKDLEVLDLMTKKMSLVKDLDKNIKQVTTMDLTKVIETMKELDKVIKQLSTLNVTKASERIKIKKLLEKMALVLESANLVDQFLNDKNKILKALEKVADISETIPVIESVLDSKDF